MFQCLVEFVSLLQKSDKFLSFRIEEDRNTLDKKSRKIIPPNLSLVLLCISNLTNELRLNQLLLTETIEANKSLKTDANGAH